MQNHPERVAEEHQRFLDMLPSVPKPPVELVASCALRVSQGETICCALCAQTVCGRLPRHMTEGLVCTLLNIPSHKDQSTRDTATPFHCPWEDWVFEVPSERGAQPSGRAGQIRHPAVADMIIRRVGWVIWSGVGGFEPPSWISLANGGNQRIMNLAGVRQGWQHEAASRVERCVPGCRVDAPSCPATNRPLLRSQSGSHSRSTVDTCFDQSSIAVRPPSCSGFFSCAACVSLYLSRLVVCRCGRQIDPFGHHRAACSRAGVLGRRGYAVESAAARVCREAGARVTDERHVAGLGPVPSSGS